MKKLCANLLPASTALSLAFCLLNTNANAQNQYFDVNGSTSGYGTSTGGSYSWDDPNWGTSGGTGTTTVWGAGTFARFYGPGSYTVTANNVESMAGMYANMGSGSTLTINGAGSGALSIVSGDQGFLAASGTTTIINAVVTGSGGLAPELSGTYYLNGNNTYTGGTTWGYSGTPLVYFDNNNSFGTGAIKSILGSGSFAPLLSTGGTVSTPLTITLANPFSVSTAGSGFNFASSAYTPVVLNGDFTLPNGAATIKNNGNSTAPLTINGNLNTGGTSANVIFSGNNGGTTLVAGNNFGLQGTVTVGAAGATAITLQLAPNAISSASKVVLAGGTLDPNGATHSMGSTVLSLASSSTITFAGGPAEIDWANSSGQAWTGTLNLSSWNSAQDALEFGTDATGLTQAQLNEIAFNGGSPGGGYLNAEGYLVVPEPSSVILGMVGGLGLLGLRMMRRRTS
jgi:hypothetical protein